MLQDLIFCRMSQKNVKNCVGKWIQFCCIWYGTCLLCSPSWPLSLPISMSINSFVGVLAWLPFYLENLKNLFSFEIPYCAFSCSITKFFCCYCVINSNINSEVYRSLTSLKLRLPILFRWQHDDLKTCKTTVTKHVILKVQLNFKLVMYYIKSTT